MTAPGGSLVSEEPAIVFSVKELIGRLDGKLDLMMKILTDKADRADVTALDHRVGLVEEKVSSITLTEKQRREIEQGKGPKRRWVITTLIAASVALAAIIGLVITILSMH